MAEGAAKKAAPAKKTEGEPPPDVAEDSGIEISQWEFLDRVPTRPEVVELLESLPPVWEVKTVDFADYVQVLPQTKKTKVPNPDGKGKHDVWNDAFVVYMSVAGRIKMIQAAAELNGWSVEFLPEMGVSPPGFIDMGEASNRIVYREYCKIEQVRGTEAAPLSFEKDGDPLPEPVLIGSKPGMAWVPVSGGKQAAGSNPYEKVETAARGRAIAAWGFGVLPGSGVASVEEVLGAAANQRALERQSGGPQNGGGRQSREQLMQALYQTGEQVRQKKNWEVPQLQTVIGEYLSRKPSEGGPGLGIADAWDAEAGVDFTKVTDGNLFLLGQYLNGLLGPDEHEGMM